MGDGAKMRGRGDVIVKAGRYPAGKKGCRDNKKRRAGEQRKKRKK
jgi:hypothetical protein